MKESGEFFIGGGEERERERGGGGERERGVGRRERGRGGSRERGEREMVWEGVTPAYRH